MATQNRNYAYNNQNRNAKIVSFNGSAAPKVKPVPQKRPQLEIVKTTRRTAAQVRAQTAADTKKAIKVLIIAAAVLLFMALAIYSRVQLDEINREINSIENKIELAESDSIKLNNQLNAVVSMNNVENYATDVLGMVKIQDHQVVYIDLSGDDYVAVANGKQTRAPEVIKDE